LATIGATLYCKPPVRWSLFTTPRNPRPTVTLATTTKQLASIRRLGAPPSPTVHHFLSAQAPQSGVATPCARRIL
jgi:hypothetical protein